MFNSIFIQFHSISDSLPVAFVAGINLFSTVAVCLQMDCRRPVEHLALELESVDPNSQVPSFLLKMIAVFSELNAISMKRVDPFRQARTL